MTKRTLERFAGAILATIIFNSPVNAQSREAPAAKGAPALSEQAKKGKLIFNDYCYRCHEVDSERAKPLGPMGPQLAGIFKREKLIVGKPVTEANVKDVIKMGPTPGMPGFRYTLSDQQIDDVLAYLKVK
jgi:mono/diheme cytochrome c family protein